MKGALAIALVLASVVPAWAKGDEDEEAEDEGEEEEEAEAEAPKTKAKEATTEEGEEEEEETDDGLRPKQNLTGHDLGTNKRINEFERDRFFVDKVDSEKTAEGTLIQGSLASSSFVYAERGGNYDGDQVGGNAGPTRLFTELRLQTDFRHIAASRWEARIDARARVVNSLAPATNGALTEENNLQSGLTGQNEYDIRELWLIRPGKRTDFFLGRQFVPDLGGVKFDGLRFDYAKSAKLTLIGFGGLYPVRGSRSLTTDYAPLENETGSPAGRLVATGGAGAAYRTVSSYGAIGAVTMVPLKIESPRVYVTSQGYLRNGATLDVYHFALVDLLGSGAAESTGRIQLTNLSLGANAKPNPRLRLTASFHRVDTETLNVQAGAFLNDVDTMPGGNTVVQNEAYILRLATNSARAGVSAGLGAQQRFEISTAVSFRNRPKFTLLTPDTTDMDVTLPAANSVEVWGSIVDRRSFASLRLGVDGSRSFGIGKLAYQRSEALLVRAFASREIGDGRGEWEAEVSYSDIRDSVIGTTLPTCGAVESCYGTSNNKLYSAGGQLFYRIKADWFGIGTLHVLRIENRRSDDIDDPAIFGITGFMRIAKRF